MMMMPMMPMTMPMMQMMPMPMPMMTSLVQVPVLLHLLLLLGHPRLPLLLLQGVSTLFICHISYHMIYHIISYHISLSDMQGVSRLISSYQISYMQGASLSSYFSLYIIFSYSHPIYIPLLVLSLSRNILNHVPYPISCNIYCVLHIYNIFHK